METVLTRKSLYWRRTNAARPGLKFIRLERVRNNWKKAVLTLLLVLSVSIVAAGTVYTTTLPDREGRFTEFYLLTENESGNLAATGYPREFTPDERKSLVIGIENHEEQRTNYTVVVELQRVERENGSVNVIQQRELQRFHTVVPRNETELTRHTIAPSMSGTQLRMVYLLYRGDPPSNLTTENAYREVHLWIDVLDTSGG